MTKVKIAESSVKDTNPKDAIGSKKLPLHLVPDSMKMFASMAFAEGASKYGANNWRVAGVRASVYKAALERHLSKYWNGEDVDPETGVPHLASCLACIGIIIDAGLVNKLTDDRPPYAPMNQAIQDAEKIVVHVFELNKDKNPKHYVLGDS